MPDYHALFPVGTTVRIVEKRALEDFRLRWRLHHGLQREQLAFASATVIVSGVSYYHGGAPLYELEGIPGTWHEACLVEPPPQAPGG